MLSDPGAHLITVGASTFAAFQGHHVAHSDRRTENCRRLRRRYPQFRECSTVEDLYLLPGTYRADRFEHALLEHGNFYFGASSLAGAQLALLGLDVRGELRGLTPVWAPLDLLPWPIGFAASQVAAARWTCNPGNYSRATANVGYGRFTASIGDADTSRFVFRRSLDGS